MKKYLRNLVAMTSIIVPIGAVLSCSHGGKTEISVSEKFLKNDSTVQALKKKFIGKFDTSKMQVIFNKAEVADQFKKVIGLFNGEFGTNLKPVVVGGTTTIDNVAASKIAESDNDILLVSSATANYFRNNKASFIDTDAKIMLDDSSIDSSKQLIIDGKKHMMDSMSEGYGVIYNKNLFNDMGITVHEGGKTPVKKAAKDELVSLASNLLTQSYDKVAEDGVYEVDKKLDIYTNDMTKQGWVQLINFIKSKGKKSFFPLDKAGKNDIWPMTNHVVGIALTAEHRKLDTMANIGSEDITKVFTSNVLKAIDWATKLYSADPASKNSKTNSVSSSVSSLAAGQISMLQQGTWNNGDLKKDDNPNHFGFLPIPVFNAAGKSVIPKTISQWWAVTKLGNDAKKMATAKMFLQFLYKTKSGLEAGINDLSFASPFKKPEGIVVDSAGNELFGSLANYSGSVVSSASDTLMKVSLNNNSEPLVAWFNNPSRPTTASEFKANMATEWNALLDKLKA